MNRRQYIRLTLAAPAALIGGAGCGGGSDYQVSGTVTYNNQPVKRGFITLSPNTEKGNSGPGGGAEIVDGKFKTERGKGIVGGSYWVRIVGYDGIPHKEAGEEIVDGKPLFPPYEFEEDFPKQDVSKDFAVPLKPPPSKRKGPKIDGVPDDRDAP